MTGTITAEDRVDTLSIVRQPVFDRNQRLWGYLLCCIGGPVGTVSGTLREDKGAIGVTNSAQMGLQQIVERGKKAIIDFSERNLLDRLPYALPPEQTVIQFAETVFESKAVAGILHQLKNDGYLIAVTGFSGQEQFKPLYVMADILSLNLLGQASEALTAAVALASAYPATLLATQVEDRSGFTIGHDLGFDLFLGTFFKRPDKVSVRQLTSNEVARFKLMHAIEQVDPDFNQLAETIQADVSISFRLLAYLNSAAFGLRQKINSIQQAIALLGWRKMKNWLRVVLLTDINQRQEASELTTLAAQRGKFLELIAQAHDFWGFDPESLHMLGIFSLLDAMLDIPMEQIVGYLPLDEKLKAALCRDPNNEYQPLLRLAECFEEARWQDAATMVQQLNLNSAKVTSAFQQAIDWAADLTTLHAAALAA